MTMQMGSVTSAPSVGAGATSDSDLERAQPKTWPLAQGQFLTTPKPNRERSISQPQQGTFLKFVKEEQMKRRSWTNPKNVAVDLEVPYGNYPFTLNVNGLACSGDLAFR